MKESIVNEKFYTSGLLDKLNAAKRGDRHVMIGNRHDGLRGPFCSRL